MTLFISDKNVETCKFRTQILANFHMKWLWQNGSTLASHARGPGFESWARQSFLLLLNTSKSDKNVETRKINKSADVISSFIQKEKTLVKAYRPIAPKLISASDSCYPKENKT